MTFAEVFIGVLDVVMEVIHECSSASDVASALTAHLTQSCTDWETGSLL